MSSKRGGCVKADGGGEWKCVSFVSMSLCGLGYGRSGDSCALV